MTLFIICTNGVFEDLPNGVAIFVFSDDTIVVMAGPTIRTTSRKVQAAMIRVAKWDASVGFTMLAPKNVRCHVYSFGPRVKQPPITDFVT